MIQSNNLEENYDTNEANIYNIYYKSNLNNKNKIKEKKEKEKKRQKKKKKKI